MRRAGWLVLANLGLAFVLTEMALRVQEPFLGLMSWGYYSSPNYRYAVIDHPVWDHQLRPDLEGLRLRVGRPVKAEEFEFTLRTNAWGCRGAPFPVPRPEGRFRVIVMGDSFTEGYHEEDTVTRHLERALEAWELPLEVEVMNCGVSSYSMLTTLLRLREQLLATRPDAVIVNVDLTDLHDDYYRRRPDLRTSPDGSPLAVGHEGSRHTGLRDFTERHSYAVRALTSYGRLLEKSVKNALEEAFEAESPSDPSPRRRPLYTVESQYWLHTSEPGASRAFEAAWGFYAEPLERLVALCRRERIACAFSIYPHEPQLATEERPATLHRGFARRLDAFLAERGVAFFDLFEPVAAAYARDPSIYFTQDMHFTPAGQRAWGEAFAAALGPWVREVAERSLAAAGGERAETVRDVSDGP